MKPKSVLPKPIERSEWPRDAPSPSEERVLSIVCGNSHLHWALHEGSRNKFIPILFWNTPHIVTDNDRNSFNAEDPCDILHRYLASRAQEVIFGSVTAPSSLEAASGAAAKRKAPYLSIFVISSNPEQEVKLQFLFRDIPAKLVQLRNTDFFSDEEGVYPTMGVDRCAGLYAAKANYGCPVLLLDGGTAMTYTALDADSNIIGGGISSGVKLRFQALSDNCGKLPMVDHCRFKTAVTNAIERREPIPFFAKDTESAMMTTVCSELACQLRNIVKQFVASVVPEEVATLPWMNNHQACISPTESVTILGDGDGEGIGLPKTILAAGEAASEQRHKTSKNTHKLLPVVVTGGDGKLLCDLLKQDASHIVQVEPGVVPVPPIEVYSQKTIIHYGVANLLEKKCNERKALHPHWMLETKLQGLRVVIAEPKSGSTDEADVDLKRGSVVYVEQGDSVDEFMFLVRLDAGETQQWNSIKLFDGLMLYNEVGELTRKNTFVIDEENWVDEKKVASIEAQEELATRSVELRDRQRELCLHKVRGELADVLCAPAREELRRRAAEKARREAVKIARPLPPAKRAKTLFDPEQFVGRRVAKTFSVEDEDDPNVLKEVLYFGTVAKVSDRKRVWFYIKYDDDDDEEYNLDDLTEALDLYEEHESEDVKKPKAAVRDDGAGTTNAQGIHSGSGMDAKFKGISEHGTGNISLNTSATIAATVPMASLATAPLGTNNNMVAPPDSILTISNPPFDPADTVRPNASGTISTSSAPNTDSTTADSKTVEGEASPEVGLGKEGHQTNENPEDDLVIEILGTSTSKMPSSVVLSSAETSACPQNEVEASTLPRAMQTDTTSNEVASQLSVSTTNETTVPEIKSHQV